MGKLEQKSAKRGRGKGRSSKRQYLQKAILSSIALVGMLGVGLVAPNVLGAMAKLGIIPIKRQKEYISNSCRRLLRQGLLREENGCLSITPEGSSLLRHLQLQDIRLKKPKRWDGKWRVLIFDIPQTKNLLRDKLRRTLMAIGFIRLQDSVWIYPYDCEDLITLLKTDFRVGDQMLYMIVDSLENDDQVKEDFDL